MVNEDCFCQVCEIKEDCPLTALAEKDNTDLELRLFIALNHGHEGIYLDDGEIQCGLCMQLSKTLERVWDYKRNPLPQLIRQALLARNQQIASLTEDFEAVSRTAGLQAEEIAALKDERDMAHKRGVELCGQLNDQDEQIAALKELSTNLAVENKDAAKQIVALTAAVESILPMAKGYTAEHPVGRNQEIVNEAQEALRGGEEENVSILENEG